MMLPKVDGIYNIETINRLFDLGVRRFSFDMRPRSLNFIQHYKVIEIVAQSGISHSKKFFFHFENDHPMLIEKFINDLADSTGVFKNDWQSRGLQLEFSAREDFALMDDFGVPYRWHYFDHASWSKAASAINLKGLVISFNVLEQALERGVISQFCNDINMNFATRSVHLTRDWDANIFPSLADYLNFEDVSLPIDLNVEESFRSVDFKKLELGIRPFIVPS